MSMTEPTTEQSAPAPKKAKAKRHARPNKRQAAPAPKVSELAGLTINDCADGCYKTGKCVISGSVCAHPGKGGLQVALQTPDSLRRFNAAKRMLGKQKLNIDIDG